MALDALSDSELSNWVGEVALQPRSQSTVMDAKSKLVVALDAPTVDDAKDLVKKLDGVVGVYKIGLELVMSEGGLRLARELRKQGKNVFLDMKLLDIGNTVEKAVANVARGEFNFLTVHGKNPKVLSAAVNGRKQALMEGYRNTLQLLAVTVLTDQDQNDLSAEGIKGLTPLELVVQRAVMAKEAGFEGVIASGHEATAIRNATDENFIIKVPGIRPANSQIGDQKRAMTPAQAIRAGATYIVVGRPIYQDPKPRSAAQRILQEIEEAFL